MSSEEFNADSLIIDKDDEGRRKELGRGGFGVVFSGKYHDRKVAIKIPLSRDFFLPEEEEDFEREVNTMERWRHEAIVEFIGAVKIRGKQMIVTELCAYGSLDKALREHPDYFNEQMKVKCLLNTSSAMNYLHSNGIMHRDLKPQNLLVVSLDWRDAVVAKLTDFGTTRAEKRMNTLVSTKTQTTITMKVGTDMFMAPEILLCQPYDKSVYVYSFSMLIYTIFAERTVFEDKAFSGGDPCRKIADGTRPSIPSSCSDDIRRLMQSCWDKNPSKRPSFDQIHAFFERCFLEHKYGSKEGAEAALMAQQLLNKMPQLDIDEILVWTLGGGTDFEQLCKLLETNAIPTKRIEFKRKIVKNS